METLTAMQVKPTQPAPKVGYRTEPPRPSARPLVAAALVSALLLWLCFFPMAWGSVLGWVALVPLLCLVRSQARPRAIYGCSYLAGLAFFFPALRWMTVADDRMYATWAGLAIYCAAYFPVAVWLLRRLDRFPLFLTLPCVWVGLEFARSYLLSGFAWYYLAHTQHQMLALIQIADLTGVYGISVLVAMVNAFGFELLCLWPRFRTLFGLGDARWGRLGLILQGAIAVLFLSATLGYGIWRLGTSDFSEGPRIALLQGNIDQRLKNVDPSDLKQRFDAFRMISMHFDVLARAAAAEAQRTDFLIVWPETATVLMEWEQDKRVRFHDSWIVTDANVPVPSVPEEFQKQEVKTRAVFESYAKSFRGVNLLLGVHCKVFVGPPADIMSYNSALFFHGSGVAGERFDKMHRVPFGEFLPFEDELPFMQWVSPYPFKYSITAGDRFTRFPLGHHRFGVLICYEDTDPFLARRYAVDDKDGEPVDFLVNMSNDGWFDGSCEHEEHLAVARFRAIETRRSVARSVNMGISALIDPNGRVLQPSTTIESATVQDNKMRFFRWSVGMQSTDMPVSEWHKFKKVPGVLLATIPVDSRASVYAKTGDVLPWVCWGGVLIGIGWACWRRLQMVLRETASQ